MKAHFTESWLSRLRFKPGGAAQQLHWDDTEEGFGVRVSPAGTVAWVVQLDGKRKTLGRYPEMSLDEARRGAAKVRNRISPIDELIEHPTLHEALVMYYAARVTSGAMRIETSHDYETVMSRYLGDKLNRKLREVGTVDVKLWYEEICANTVAKANYAMRIMHAVYAYHIALHPAWGLANPVQILTTLKLWKKVKKSRAIVPKDTLPAWFDALDRAPPRLRTILMLALFAGLRKENASGLRIEWVDTAARVIRIPDEKMKGKASFDLPIGPALAALLEAAKPAADSGWYFAATSPDDEGHYREFYGAIGTVAERSGVKFSPHAVRRTFATIAYSLGVQTITIGRLLSHSLEHAPRNEDVTGGYINDSCETLRVHVEAVERAVLEMAGRTSLTMCPVHIAAAPSTPRAAPHPAPGYDVEDGAMVI